MNQVGNRLVLFGMGGFILENLVLSENRDFLIEKFGESAYHNGYSVLSTLALGTTGLGVYRGHRAIAQGPGNIRVSFPIRTMGLFFQILGAAGIVQFLPGVQPPIQIQDKPKYDTSSQQSEHPSTPRFAARCPIDFKPRDVPADGIYGLQRITRHPMNYSLAFFFLGMGIKSPAQSPRLFALLFLAWAMIGSAHQDKRYRRGSGGSLTPEKERITSNFPFLALIQGHQSWSSLQDELKWWNISLSSSILLLLHFVKK